METSQYPDPTAGGPDYGKALRLCESIISAVNEIARIEKLTCLEAEIGLAATCAIVLASLAGGAPDAAQFLFNRFAYNVGSGIKERLAMRDPSAVAEPKLEPEVAKAMAERRKSGLH